MVEALSQLQGLVGAKRAVLQFARPDSGVHAVLFYGPRGSGKGELARILASSWLGEEGSQAVTSFANGRNADVLEVEPMGASRIINVRQITASRGSDDKFDGFAVTEFLRTSPLTSQRKVVIIHDAERMNGAAANALLKSLEEPHPYARFILMTASVGNLLPTILSRCVAVACELPESGVCEDSQIDPELWRLAGGAPGEAKKYQEHHSLYRAILQFGKSLRTRPLTEALIASESLKGLADELQKAHDLNARAANAEALDLLARAVHEHHPDWNATASIAEAHRRILGNANSALVFDALMAEILGT